MSSFSPTQQQSSPKRKRKVVDYLQRPVKFGKGPRDIVSTKEQFEKMMQKPYGPRKDKLGIMRSGKDRLGHTLYWDDGIVRCRACNNKRVVFGAVVKHIIGKEHCRKVGQIHKNKEGVADSQQQLNKQDDAVVENAVVENAEDETIYGDNLVQDLAKGGDNNTAKRKAHTQKAKAACDVENSQNALIAEGGLVINGLDIVKYIRGLEGRISVLERKLEASNDNSVVDL